MTRLLLAAVGWAVQPLVWPPCAYAICRWHAVVDQNIEDGAGIRLASGVRGVGA